MINYLTRQFSILNSGSLANSFSFEVTNVRPLANAVAAIRKSYELIGVPSVLKLFLIFAAHIASFDPKFTTVTSDKMASTVVLDALLIFMDCSIPYLNVSIGEWEKIPRL